MQTLTTNPFLAAKPFLNPGDEGWKSGFICFAIAEAAHREFIPKADAAVAHQLVMTRLGGQATIQQWLQNIAKIPAEERTWQQVQQYRHRWLDHLALEWDKGIRQ